jgi:hypothetical protein
MARPKKPHVATLNEVRILREGDTAIIEYLDPSIATTHLRIGAEIAALTDQQILNLFNDSIAARERLAASYRHVAVEIPPGRPQVRY